MPEPRARNPSSLCDTGSAYGWASILLHWLSAMVVIALWFLGQGISSSDEIDGRRALHVSLAGTFWLVLLLRAGWRLRSGHPRVRGQSRTVHRIASAAHYAMLALLLLMLGSGPVVVWAGGNPIGIFEVVSIPAPFAASDAIQDAARAVHETSAVLLAALVALHIGGALKHLMFHADDTIVRMLWPPRSVSDD